MSLTVSEPKGTDFILPPPGSHLARCYRVIDLGTQKTTFKGEQKAQKKIMLVWELHGEDAEGGPLVTPDGRPLVVSRRFTPSLSTKASLRAFLVSWRGKQFNADELEAFKMQNILDKWCMANLTHTEPNADGKVYCNVSSISPVPVAIKKAGLPEGSNPVVWFDIDEPDMKTFEEFPEYLKNIISSSPEWQMRQFGKQPGLDNKPDDEEQLAF